MKENKGKHTRIKHKDNKCLRIKHRGGTVVRHRAIYLFRLGLAVALASIILSSYLMAHAQSGPSWEVPAAVMMELQTLPLLSMLLAILAIALYVWASRLGDFGDSARFGFVAVVVCAFVLPCVIWLFKPEQWPFQYEMLSFFAAIQIVPVFLAAVILFRLIGFRWNRSDDSRSL